MRLGTLGGCLSTDHLPGGHELAARAALCINPFTRAIVLEDCESFPGFPAPIPFVAPLARQEGLSILLGQPMFHGGGRDGQGRRKGQGGTAQEHATQKKPGHPGAIGRLKLFHDHYITRSLTHASFQMRLQVLTTNQAIETRFASLQYR